MQAMGGADAMVLAGRVLMQLGSPEKAVSDAVKEVIRILKKTQPAEVPQVCSLLQAAALCSNSPLLQTSHATVAACQTCRCMMFGTCAKMECGAWLVMI